MEEKRYCINCGTENKIHDKVCCSCNEDLHQEESLFVDFLIERTKDKFKGSIQDSIYDTIMNFLLSHLYGTVLTVSIVSYAVVSSGIEVVNAINNNYIEKVNHPPIILEDENNPDILNESEIVSDVVSDYVSLFKDYNTNVNLIKSMEATSGTYSTNLAYDFEMIKDPYISYGLQISEPMIDSEFPQGQIAETLYNNDIHYAQVYMEISQVINGNSENIGVYLFTLAKENEDWLVVEADKIGSIQITTMEDFAYSAVNSYRYCGIFPDYETYTDAQYNQLISYRLPNSYGYSTSYEFTLDHYMPGANGCLNYSLVTSGINPSQPKSNIGSRLNSNGIPFFEYILTEDSHGPDGYIGKRTWLIVVGYFDSNWYIVEDKLLSEEKG